MLVAHRNIGPYHLSQPSARSARSARSAPPPRRPANANANAISATKHSIEVMAKCKTRQELEDIAPTIHGADWHTMDWEKPAERGILFILQGVSASKYHHIWSCADKPPKLDDDRFFKEVR